MSDQPTRKRATANGVPKPAPPERDWVDQMVDSLATLAENARKANAADAGASSVSSQGLSTRRLWFRRRERTA